MSKKRYSEYQSTASATVRYSFRCEKCNLESGTLLQEYSCTEKKRLELNERLPLGEIRTLYEKAEAKLKALLENEKHAEHPRGIAGDTCPHCAHKQSWGIKRALLSSTILTAIGWVLLGAIGSMVSGVFKLRFATWKIYVLALLVCGALFFFKPLIRIVRNKGLHASSFPTVYWETLSEVSGAVILVDHNEGAWKRENREVKHEYRWTGENDLRELRQW